MGYNNLHLNLKKESRFHKLCQGILSHKIMSAMKVV